MDGVEQKVDTLLSNRVFKSEAQRIRVRDALIKTLRPLEAFKSFEDDDAYENAPGDIRQDDSDGVPCVTIAELDISQQVKKAALRKSARELFSDPGDDGSIVIAEGTETEDEGIDRRLKWGYTLLHFAAQKGDEVECDRLIALGASKTAQENGGKYPWQKAELMGHEALAIKLRP